MRILITGACGMLGSQLIKVLKDKHELICTDVSPGYSIMDISNKDEVFSTIIKNKPELVIHCAAMTDVDGCTRNPDLAYKVNAVGTWLIASACASIDCKMVYISTDYVFDGDKGESYTEYDSVNPISPYGSSKLAGEEAVKDLLNKHIIVRTSWVFSPVGKNFARSIINAAQANKELKVVADQFGSPTYAKDLAEFISGLIESPLYGTYHFTNAGSCSWYEFAKRIIETAGIKDVEVIPIKSEEWPTPTKRPKYSVLRHYKMELLGQDLARKWEDAVVEFVSEWTIAKQ